jgi:predicted nucleotidyltransferase
LAVYKLRNVPGVTSIYLRRGLASGEIIYGLSDIDLLVLLDDNHILNKEKVNKAYDRLSSWNPLFGEKEKEFGINTISEFRQLYDEHPSYRYRFDEGKHQWKLLFGINYVDTLETPTDEEINLLAIEELKVWWSFLIEQIKPENPMPLFKRKYLWYKTIAEAAKIYLMVAHRNRTFSRKTAMKEIFAYLPAEFRPTLQIIAGYLKKLTDHEPMAIDDSFQLLIWLIINSIDKTKEQIQAFDKQVLANINASPQYNEISKNNGNLILDISGPILKDIEPFIERISIIPQVEFDIDILDNSDIDSWYLAIMLNKVPPVSVVSAVIKTVKNNLIPEKVRPFIVIKDELALSLNSDKAQFGIKSSYSDPIFFALLDGKDNTSCRLSYNFRKTLYTRKKE